MLYQYYNFDDNFYNADGGGKREIVLSELSQLIANDPQAIRGALNQAGIQMDVSASPKKLQRTIFRHAKKKGRRGKKMIRNLSILIFAKTKIGEDKFDTFFKGKGGGGKIKGLGGKIKGFLGGIFKKGTDGKSKAGTFFKNNKDSIFDIGGSLFGGLLNRGGRSQVNTQVSGYQSGGGGRGGGGGGATLRKKGMSMGAKIGIGVGVVAVIGLIVFLATRRK